MEHFRTGFNPSRSSAESAPRLSISGMVIACGDDENALDLGNSFEVSLRTVSENSQNLMIAVPSQASRTASTGTRRSMANRRTTLSLRDLNMLRATWPSILLEDFGRRLRESVGGVGCEDPDLADDEYLHSFVVDELDVFLSHSWHAPWFPKYMALLLHFNLKPAAVTYAIVIVFSSWLWRFVAEERRCIDNHSVGGHSLMDSHSMLCSGYVFHLMGSCMFAFVLFTWHRFAFLLSGICSCCSLTIWLDKVCIHQANPIIKAKGIKAIGAILSNTKTLLVAWDPGYFQRLWCAYELHAFAHSHRWEDSSNYSIQIIPIHLSKFQLTIIILSVMNQVIKSMIYLIYGFGPRAFWLAGVIKALTFVIGIPSVRKYQRDRQRLMLQLRNFSIRSTRCFCCDSEHVHPESGRRLPCDRDVVYRSIVHWHGGSDENEALDELDAHIRATLETTVMEGLGGPAAIPYLFAITVGMLSNGSFLSMGITLCQCDWQPLDVRMGTVVVIFLASPLSLALCLSLSRLFSRRCRWKCAEYLVNLGIAFATETAITIFHVVDYSVRTSGQGFLGRLGAYAILFAVITPVVAWLYLTRPPWHFLGRVRENLLDCDSSSFIAPRRLSRASGNRTSATVKLPSEMQLSDRSGTDFIRRTVTDA